MAEQEVQQPVECPPQENAEPIPSAEQIEQMNQVQQAKQAMLNSLAHVYGQFIAQIRIYAASPLQQQQAFIRFDEGHFWLQQSIMQAQIECVKPQEPAQPESPPESTPVGEPQSNGVEL